MRTINGAFLISRSIYDSGIWRKPPEWLKIWLYLLGNVNFEDNNLFKRGENFFKYEVIALSCDVSINTVNKCIKYLITAEQIQSRKTSRGAILSINNYDTYQNMGNYGRTEAEQKQNRSRTGTNTITEECNNVRKKEGSYENDSNVYKIMSFVGSAPETLGSTPKTPRSTRRTLQVVHDVHPNQNKLNQNQEIEYSKNKELNSAICEWIEYKKERREGYKPTGLKSFITQCHSYTPESVIEQMSRAMASNWMGPLWDNCIKIPKIDKNVDFSTMEKNEIFEKVKNNRELLEQLKYQNPKAYDGMKYILNIASQYGC